MLPRQDLWNHAGDCCPLAPGCSTPSREGHELSGRLHRHAQAVGDGDGLVGPDALKLISSSSPSEATSKPNISTSQRKSTASCWLCWSVVFVGGNFSHAGLEPGVEQTLGRDGREVCEVVADVAEPADESAEVVESATALGFKLVGDVVEFEVFQVLDRAV
jgi:hypothetical protein